MKRAGLVVFFAVLALTAGASAGARTAADTITLRARVHEGAWRRSLTIKFARFQLKPFSLCATFDAPAAPRFSCADVRGQKLPEGTVLRLEQNPIGKALRRRDSPGWGMLGQSVTTSLGAAVSNTETGNKAGTWRYRVTLRNAAGKVLVTSNVLRVTWRR